MDWLFNTSLFVTRQDGPGWTESLQFIYKFSNLVIAFSYISIPFMILAIWHKRRNDVAQPWMLLLFASFIFLCGWIHLNDILEFYWPAHRFFTLINAITASVSFIAACLMPSVVLGMLKLPSRGLIHQLNNDLGKMVLARQIENNKLTETNKELLHRIEILENMLETNAWMHDKATAMQQLKEMVLQIGPQNPQG